MSTISLQGAIDSRISREEVGGLAHLLSCPNKGCIIQELMPQYQWEKQIEGGILLEPSKLEDAAILSHVAEGCDRECFGKRIVARYCDEKLLLQTKCIWDFKWNLSQRLGYDVGIDIASIVWTGEFARDFSRAYREAEDLEHLKIYAETEGCHGEGEARMDRCSFIARGMHKYLGMSADQKREELAANGVKWDVICKIDESKLNDEGQLISIYCGFARMMGKVERRVDIPDKYPIMSSDGKPLRDGDFV